MEKKVSLKDRLNGLAKKATYVATVASCTAMTAPVMALAEDDAGNGDWSGVNITASSSQDAGTLMGNILGILLTITRYVGVAMVIYGVYEIVMSFMQNQPEAKTKGIVMALSGVVMIGLKGVLVNMNIIT
jgi:hypothetical protein